LLRRRFPVVLLSTVMLLAVSVPATARIPFLEGPTRTVFLVRHGFYDTADTTDPDVGRALLALGRQQARVTAARLDAMPVAFSSLQASAMTRARQTAELLAPHFPDLDLQIHRDIRECTMTTRRDDVMAELEPGEAEACEERLEGAWRRLFTPAMGPDDEFDIVVCHGNVIRWFVTRALDVDPTAWLGMSVAHCSITTIQVRGDGSFKVIGVGDSGHLPYDMTTFGGDDGEQ
jgi:serine/threonine-protein phosphatase PGAM5